MQSMMAQAEQERLLEEQLPDAPDTNVVNNDDLVDSDDINPDAAA